MLACVNLSAANRKRQCCNEWGHVSVTISSLFNDCLLYLEIESLHNWPACHRPVTTGVEHSTRLCSQ